MSESLIKWGTSLSMDTAVGKKVEGDNVFHLVDVCLKWMSFWLTQMCGYCIVLSIWDARYEVGSSHQGCSNGIWVSLPWPGRSSPWPPYCPVQCLLNYEAKKISAAWTCHVVDILMPNNMWRVFWSHSRSRWALHHIKEIERSNLGSETDYYHLGFFVVFFSPPAHFFVAPSRRPQLPPSTAF